jgi:polyisoprenoid-binding protein YceI
MRNIIKVGALVVLLATVLMPVATAQKSVVLIPSESKILISGTSNLHEWEENVSKFDVSMQLLSDGAGDARISKLSFTSKSASVVSDNSIMTSKTHDALQVEKHPEITFISQEGSVLDMKGNTFSGSLVGDLILNGVTKHIVIAFNGTMTGDRLEVTGTQTLNMTDYNIKPPTAILGTLKTGDKVTVTFALKFRIG